MKKLLVLVVVAVAAVAVFKYLDKTSAGDADRKRVADLLQAMRENDEQKALCLWALDRVSADAETMQRYYNEYVGFVEETGMRVGTSWSIFQVVPSESEHATLVTVASEDGERITLRVRKYVPIEVVRTT
jgi:uridine phosphorylase